MSRALSQCSFEGHLQKGFLARQDIAQKLLDATGGNPQALGELFERPVTAIDFFVRRVERLTEAQRSALAVLAIAPEALPVEWLAATLGGGSVRLADESRFEGLFRDSRRAR